jgi:ketosteroid isomerase-like protein
LRNAERFRDFGKSKFVPNFHDQHFALISWQAIEGCHQLALRIIQLLKLRLHRPFGLAKNFDFPPRPSAIPSNEIEGSGANGGVKQGTVFNAEIASPETDESFLHHVLGIGRAPHPLPGEQDKPGRELRKTDFPIFMGGGILHDPSRSLLLRRRQLLNLSVTQKLFLAGAVWAVSLSTLAQLADPSAAREIATVDGEYSNLSVAKGMPAASVEYFAEHGVAFAPGAVNGKKYWAGRTDFSGTLIWQPIFAFAAGAADLGYTTGMWELKNPGSLAFGHYISTWTRQRDGQWKIALDVGTENPQPPEPPPGLQLLSADVTAGVQTQENSRRGLQRAERQFVQAAHNGIGQAILHYATDDIRVYREKSFPAVGLVAARLMLTSENGKATFESGGSKMSRSGDLSFSYGNYSEERGNAVEHGIYLLIWRANMNGDWKLALNLQKKFPPTVKR